MKAAVVSAFGTPPRYVDVETPRATRPDDVVVDLLAAGLHPRVRSQADGTHYTSTDELPLVPGIDGVGRDADGSLRYFVLPDTPHGSMAERVLIDRRRSIVLPDTVDPVAAAAVMNPAMSSWIALRRRIEMVPGSSVLILGATGSAGLLAVQIARLCGAATVIAAGRDAFRLQRTRNLGATHQVVLGDADGMARVAADVDVVLDYLWGEPGSATMSTLVAARADPGRPLTWVQIGSVAGPTAAVPSAALRACRLSIVGSGQGSVATGDILRELPSLAQAVADGTLRADVRPMPLADVERAWAAAPTTTQRIVLVPR